MRDISNYVAGGAVAARRIVKFGSADTSIVQGAAATDLLVGVSTDLPSASGGRVDVIHSGEAEVTFGGSITRGAKVTSDANGKAVAAAPAAGAKAQTIGIALVSGADGDIGRIRVIPGQVTEPA